MTPPIALGPVMRAFFTDHLLQQKQVSPQTVAAYRDAVRLLLTFLHQHRQIAPDQVTLDDLDAPVILAFLDYLEGDRHNSARSRNARLAALRSFFRFVAFRWPDRLDVTARVLAIPRKRTVRRLVHFLTREEMEALLTRFDRTTWGGRRDHALLLTLYNTGARVSELTGLRRPHVQFGPSTIVQLFGKGRKERIVPLWARTGRVLRAWFDELGDATPDIAFPNAQGARLTRHGVAYLLHDVAKRAEAACSSLTTKRVSPHVIRHTTAMHLLQAGVDLATIALWLGHERLETTHLYLEADLTLKERALQHVAPLGPPARRFKADRSLLAFLTSL
jgi:site-specific recombinase XerD